MNSLVINSLLSRQCIGYWKEKLNVKVLFWWHMNTVSPIASQLMIFIILFIWSLHNILIM